MCVCVCVQGRVQGVQGGGGHTHLQMVKRLETRIKPKMETMMKANRSMPKEASRVTRPHPSVSGTIIAYVSIAMNMKAHSTPQQPAMMPFCQRGVKPSSSNFKTMEANVGMSLAA